MTDQAPESTRYVMRQLQRTEIPDRYLDLMPVETAVTARRTAETTIGRPWSADLMNRDVYDAIMRDLFRDLPGCSGTYGVTMCRTFTVEWDGIRAPI